MKIKIHWCVIDISRQNKEKTVLRFSVGFNVVKDLRRSKSLKSLKDLLLLQG